MFTPKFIVFKVSKMAHFVFLADNSKTLGKVLKVVANAVAYVQIQHEIQKLF